MATSAFALPALGDANYMYSGLSSSIVTCSSLLSSYSISHLLVGTGVLRNFKLQNSRAVFYKACAKLHKNKTKAKNCENALSCVNRTSQPGTHKKSVHNTDYVLR